MATQTLFTPGTAITNGEAVNATVTNRIVNSSGGVNDTLLQVSGYRDVLTGNSNQTVTANYDVCYYCNNTTNITITLPPASTQLANKNIRIIKIGNNTATVTVQRAGSDTIGNPYSLISVPVDTSFVIYAPGEYYEYNASGNVWYALNYNLPTSYFNANVRSTANQISVASGTVVGFNTELRDPSDSWNSSTYRYTAKVAGVYNFMGHVLAQGSVATGLQAALRQFNISNTQLQGLRCGFLDTTSAAQVFSLVISQKLTMAVGDYANVTSSVGTGTISIYGNASTTDNFTNLGISLETRV
jgi:hypothetical protein